MHVVVLAAGFGERLLPLTRKSPKSLLEVGGRPVIDRLIQFLRGSQEIEMIHVRTNALHYPAFKEWLRQSEFMGTVELSSNGISSAKGSIGAVGELENICAKKQFKQDIIVVAGDNIFDTDFSPFIEFCSGKEGDVVMVMEARSKAEFRESGVVVVTAGDRIIDFEEKPSDPKSKLVSLPLYRLSAETIPFLKKYLMEGNDPDCLGRFFAWSYRRRPLFAYRINGGRYHLTDLASYRKIRSLFEKSAGS
jgi:glucose-1-phosphate thymidylyltransferase